MAPPSNTTTESKHTIDAGIARRNERARNQLENYRVTYLSIVPDGNFDVELWKVVEIESASVDVSGTTGKATFSLVAPDRYNNYTGNMQGGAVATILDGCTNCAIALIARKGFWDGAGVTRNLNVTYVRPVQKGQKIFVYCEIIHASNRVVTIHGVMKRAEDDKVLAMCVQEMVPLNKSKL